MTTLRVGMSVTLHPIDGPVLKGEIIELGAPGHWETCAKVRIRRRDGRWRKRPEWWPLDVVTRLAPIALLLALPAQAEPRTERSTGHVDGQAPHVGAPARLSATPQTAPAKMRSLVPSSGAARSVQPWRRAAASHYAPGDGHNAGPLACRSHVRLGHDQPIVAHRTLPCGTVVELRRGGLATRAVVADRGPFGLSCRGNATTRRDPRRPWRLPRGWTWRVLARGPLPPDCYRRASFDLAPAVSKALRLLAAGVGWIEWRLSRAQ